LDFTCQERKILLTEFSNLVRVSEIVVTPSDQIFSFIIQRRQQRRIYTQYSTIKPEHDLAGR